VHVVGRTSLPGGDSGESRGAGTGGALAEAFTAAQPQALVICGGYDADTPAILAALRQLCGKLGNVLKRIPPAQYPAIIYAGNRQAAPLAMETLRADVNVLRWSAVQNVQPAPHVTDPTPLAQALHNLYTQLSRQSATYADIAQWVTPPAHVATMEANFARLVQVWMQHHHLTALHGLYCAPDWRLHVRADQGMAGVHFHFDPPTSTQIEREQWPPVRLSSGPNTTDVITWRDPLGLAPVLTAVGQVAPQAMLQALTADIFR